MVSTEQSCTLSFLTCEVFNHNTAKKTTFHIIALYGGTIIIHHIHSYQKISDLMSIKFFSLNSLVERRKPQESTDELAIVKAAAWAWYQHGSGSEGKAKSEFDVTRIQRAARPSRYKLEAMRMAKEVPSIHTNKSLLDTHEVQSISRQLGNRLIESGLNKLGNSNNSAHNTDAIDNGNRRMLKKKINKGFWPRHVVCRGKDDVVNGTVLSAKCVPAVNLANCLPRFNGAL